MLPDASSIKTLKKRLLYEDRRYNMSVLYRLKAGLGRERGECAGKTRLLRDRGPSHLNDPSNSETAGVVQYKECYETQSV